mgnify:CR=1 FL=1|tara:strand:- start:622 stop:933 length:312 start_codon:yes stop_codon:yes gene_type:complete
MSSKDYKVRDYEVRVFGILRKDNFTEACDGKRDDEITDDDWVEEAERMGYISTLDRFIKDINNCSDYVNPTVYRYRAIAFGYFDKGVVVLPKNKLDYILRYED